MNLQPSKIDFGVSDDKLYTPEIGPWAEDKYRLFWCYADLFATSMKEKWDQRVYIDLFAGAGHSRVESTNVESTNRVLLGTPLLALRVAHTFDWYIFCDQDPDCMSALRKRVETMHPTAEVRYVPEDVNRVTSQILREMPPLAPGKKMLGFCFADPFRLRDLHFRTIEILAQRYMDSMVLIPVMDPLRNEVTYLDPSCDVVDLFVGTTSWREEWRKQQKKITLDTFIAGFFSGQMKLLNYTHGGIEDSILVRSSEKNLPLYRLGFYSRHALGGRFWKEARKYSNPQLGLL